MDKHRKINALFDECVRKAKDQLITEGTIKPNPLIMVLSGTPQQIKIDLFAIKPGMNADEHAIKKQALADAVKMFIQAKQAFGYIFITDAWYLETNNNDLPKNLENDPRSKQMLMIMLRTVDYSKMKTIRYDRTGGQIIFKEERNQTDVTSIDGRFFNMLPSFN